MVEQLGSEDIDALKYVLSFLQTSLQRPPATLPADQISSEGWVRAQALQNFGPIIHSVYQKSRQSKSAPKLLQAITDVCDFFY